MARALDRKKLLDAFDDIGRAAVAANTRLTIAVFGGSALMLASNFRFATEDVDIAEIEKRPWPGWLADVVEQVAERNNWSREWLNDAVDLSTLVRWRRPNATSPGLVRFPAGKKRLGSQSKFASARYLLALKLKALRVSDFAKGAGDMEDVANLLRVLHIDGVEPAIEVLAEFFPKSAADADKQRFVLRRILSQPRSPDAPRYPRTDD